MKYNNLSDLKANGLPNLATKVIEGKTKLKYPYLGQYKLNGVRAKVQWVENIESMNGLFVEDWEHVVIISKEGNQYWMPHISKILYDRIYHLYKTIELDGEFYKHGLKLNYIKSCVPLVINGKPSTPSGNTKDVDFNIFDCIERDEVQTNRIKALSIVKTYFDVDNVNNNKAEHIEFLNTVVIHNATQLKIKRDEFIDMGYEGIILRDYYKPYYHGKRNTAMFKYKKSIMKEFKIIDIIDKGFKSGRVNITVLLQNDLNNHTFESTPGNLDESWNNELKQELLDNKENYIGKYGTVSFYERSGVKNVPFHSNFITVRNYE